LQKPDYYELFGNQSWITFEKDGAALFEKAAELVK